MAVSSSYRTYVLEQLQQMGTVAPRSMFGGVGLYHQGVFFGLIADDCLYLKVDDSTRANFEVSGCKPFKPFGDESYSMSYYEIPADVLEDRSRLRAWAEKAVAVAQKSATARQGD